MSINTIPTEALQTIFEYAELSDLVHLARTSRRIYRAFLGRRMHFLTSGLHNSFAPLPSLLKLVLGNEPTPSRKPIGTEIRINLTLTRIFAVTDEPKLTLEHMKKMVHYGRTAERWTEIYPRLRWRFGSDNRRLLRSHEKQRLRRAIYNHWTYATLFHSPTFTSYSPDPPNPLSHSDPRHLLLRSFSTAESIQLSDLLAHMLLLVELDLYPSNSVVQDYYSHTLPPKALSKIAWGEGSEYRRLVREIMKLNPRDLLYLVEETSNKTERESYLREKGTVVGDVPASLNWALGTVCAERASVGWGLDSREVTNLGFASLREKQAHTGFGVGLRTATQHVEPEEEADVPDEVLALGIVDVPGREKLAGLEDRVEADGVERGDWEVYCSKFVEGVVAGGEDEV